MTQIIVGVFIAIILWIAAIYVGRVFTIRNVHDTRLTFKELRHYIGLTNDRGYRGFDLWYSTFKYHCDPMTCYSTGETYRVYCGFWGTLIYTFWYAWHYKRIESNRKRTNKTEVFREIFKSNEE